MHVVATAGHVDHGKSTLVRALTGMEPDRYAEERRRGMTIDLGFVWTTLPSGAALAFVDVPGHERFVPTMLAGVGPVPATLLVVAADEGWSAQTAEHVAALDALGVRHGLVVVTKSDLVDPEPVAADVLTRLASTSLARFDAVAVSACTGDGMPALTRALDALVQTLPAPDLAAPVRLWVDRVFTVAGAGTVVTGTLAAGRLHVGDELDVVLGSGRAAVRGLQSLKQEVDEAAATARVAVNLRGVDRGELSRGVALVTPDAWSVADELDVTVPAGKPMARRCVVHVGSAAVPGQLRPLGPGAARLRLAHPLPLHLGDRLLLREPSTGAIVGADVADLTPPPLRRRGDAARAGSALTVPKTADDEVRRRGVVSATGLKALGLGDDPADAVSVGGWHIDRVHWQQLAGELAALLDRDDGDGVPMDVARRVLRLPDLDTLRALVGEVPGALVAGGRLARPGVAPDLPAGVLAIVDRLAADPFAAPDVAELAALPPAALARATRAGLLLHVGGRVYLGPAAVAAALGRLRALEQPFSVSQAREALGSSRRVVVPLLEHLDAARLTRREHEGRRVVSASAG